MKNLIIGLGCTGLSVARYLAAAQEDFVVLDTRTNPPLLAQFYREFPNRLFVHAALNHPLVQQSSRIILSPGISFWEKNIQSARQAGAVITNDISLFMDELSKRNPAMQFLPVVAITGSNGKTTVTNLVQQMAQKQGMRAVMAGNVGMPVLDCLQHCLQQQHPQKRDPQEQHSEQQCPQQDRHDLYILELSSFQLETIHSLPVRLACILNLGEDHLDRYDSLALYHQTKNKIWQQSAYAVLPQDYAASLLSDGVKRPEQQKQFRFGMAASDLNQPFDIRDLQNKGYIFYKDQPLIALEQLHLNGQHHYLNFLAALTIGHALGLSHDIMVDVIRAFTGLAYRCQKVASLDGVDYYNDSKATNISAMLAAVDSLLYTSHSSQGRLWLMAGGQDKQTDFTALNQIMPDIHSLLLFGQSAEKIKRSIHAMPNKIHQFDTMSAALDYARQHARSGDKVLLAPGCASFDAFQNYQHRGQVFNMQVYRYI